MIHVFKYGETQINSKDLSIKVASNTLTKLTPLLEAIFLKKPESSLSVITEFHSVNIFGYNQVRWVDSKDGFALREKGTEIPSLGELKPFIDELILELQALKDAENVI